MTHDLSTPAVIVPGTLARVPQPVLPVASGLVLRPWEPADAATVLAAYQDEEIRRWHTRRPASEARVLEWFELYREEWTQEKGGHWAVARDGGEVLGRIAMRSVNLDQGIAGIGYWVVPAARGAGVATGALSALSDWAFGEIGFHRLHLNHSTRNQASCRVATKAGYGPEGTMVSAGLHDDGWHDMHSHARIAASGGSVTV